MSCFVNGEQLRRRPQPPRAGRVPAVYGRKHRVRQPLGEPERGFSLVEILVALLLLGFCLLAVVPLFVMATRSTASAGEISTLSTEAGRQMELLRQIPFVTLAAGGSLTANQAGFFDVSNPDFIVRWRITDDAAPPTMKTIEVWARALRTPMGQSKEIRIVGMAAQQ